LRETAVFDAGLQVVLVAQFIASVRKLIIE